MEGRAAIRARLEQSLGHKLADKQFDVIWKVLQDKLAWLFYERGLRLMEEVADLIGIEVDNAVSEKPTPEFVNELSSAVGNSSALPAQQEELKLAVQDIFSERQGHAADWLGRVCAGFVIACSLGLESMCKEAIQRLAAKTVLLFDTDAATVGTSGIEGERFPELMASARSRPVATCGRSGGSPPEQDLDLVAGHRAGRAELTTSIVRSTGCRELSATTPDRPAAPV